MGLDNGLTLEVFDNSRCVGGDRWLVSFEARIEVEVKPEYFEDRHKTDVPFEDIRAVLGEKVTYRYEKVRNFVAENEKDEVFTGLRKHFLWTNLGYLSSTNFPQRLILRRYQDALSPAMAWKRH